VQRSGLRNFLIDEESIGIICTKFRSSAPLAECREAWCRRYGPVKWDNGEAEEWTKKPSMALSDRGTSVV